MKKNIFAIMSLVAFSIHSSSFATTPSFSPSSSPSALPTDIISTLQKTSLHFNGIIIPGIDSYENVYKEAFNRIYLRAKKAGKEDALFKTSKDNTAGNFGTHWYGNPKAPIKILELESLTCSHCAEFSNGKFNQIKRDYIDTGKIYYGIRQLSSDRVSVTATILAGTLDKEHYLSYTQSIYQNQYKFFNGKIENAGDVLRNISNLAGFSNEQFNKAWNNNSLGERIFLQGLSDVTYYSKALDKYNDGKNNKEFGTPFFIGTNDHDYIFSMGADSNEFDTMIKKLENKNK